MSKLETRRKIAKLVQATVVGFQPTLPADVEKTDAEAQVRHVKEPLLEKLATSVGPEA